MVSRKRFNRFVRLLGPGLVTGAADDDPSGIATYSQAGAAHGYGLLWAFPLMYPLLLAVQESCARIGAITGKGLAAVIKENYSRKLLYMSVALVVVANTVNIGADLGAMAATTQLFIGLPFALLAIFYAVLVVLLVVFVSYKSYAKMLKWLALALLAYPITAFMVGQDWPEVFRNTFTLTPTINFDTMYIFVGMLGTTVSPYLFFWDTSEVVEEEIAKRNMSRIGEIPKATKRFLHNLHIDNFVGMTLASVTAWFIVIACASTLHSSGITEINTASDAARALEPLVQGFPNAGLVAKLIFSIGIIGLGLLAVPVLAGSSSYAITEALGWKEGLHRKFKRAIGFYVVIILATMAGLAINFLGIDPIKALVFTAVFNGIAAVPLLFMIAKVGNNKKIMGPYKNGIISNTFVRLTFIIMALAVLVLFYSFVR
ncbi:divalent metal cation transporter [Candidatus Saccharibacteria bacterium]|jgi:NRAMP (natural resistance-associated macrophage protein)-like metal ion transporter|nr:divalent metal cation transporter [Candidatus Saccharibacteria bacterium]